MGLHSARRLALIALAVTIIASMLSPLCSSNSAWADPNPTAACAATGGTYALVGGNGVCTPGPSIADGFTPDQQATSYSYYVALGGCIQNNMYGDFQTTVSGDGDSSPSEWFDDNQAFGYVYPGGAKTDCKDIASEALSLWGWTGSTQTFLEAVNYTYSANTNTGKPAYDGTADGATRIKAFQSAVKNKVYGGRAPSLLAPAIYDIDFGGFTQNGGPCSAKDLGPYAGLGPTERQYVDAGTSANSGGGGRTRIPVTYVKVPVVDSTTGVSVDHGYTYSYTVTAGVGISTTTDLVTLYGYHATAKSATCEDLIAGIKKNASAYQAWIKLNSAGDTKVSLDCAAHPTDPSCSTPTSTCNIDGGLGWILCPVLTTGAKIADSAFGFLASNFLSTDPSLVNTNPDATTTDGTKVGTGTFTAWGLMRSVANVAFIIVFLIVIFSQLTSIGVSQYGVKKLLPRLIVGAVLVNLSFWVCQLAVDISNILGYSLKDLLAGVAKQVAAAGGGIAASPEDQSNNLLGITTLVLGAAAIAWINIGALVVAIVGSVVALLFIFVLLIARKALIVLLIVIAPLAFVAYLLPNTEPLFQRWRKAITSLLMLFPIIGLLYGASSLASAVLLQVASGAGDSTAVTTMKVAAYMVLVLPLVAAIPLLRGSLNSFGKIGGAIQSFGQKARSATQARAQTGFDRSRVGQFKKYREGRGDLRRAQTQSGTYEGWNPLRRGVSAINRGINQSRLSGRFGDQASATGAALENSEDAELMKSADARVGSMSFTGTDGVERPLSTAQLIQIARGGNVTDASGQVVAKAGQFDEHARRAAILRATAVANVAEAHELLDASSGMSKLERKSLTEGFRGAKVTAVAPWLSGKTLGSIEQGGITAEEATMRAIEDGKLTAEALAGGDDTSSRFVVDTLTDRAGDSAAVLGRKAALRTTVSGEAGKIFAPGSHLGERVTAGSRKGASLGTMQSW